MKILILAKQVPDTADVALNGDFTLRRDLVSQAINPADESALEAGLLLRDQNGGVATVMTMGPVRAERMLREALSRGADEAVLLTDPAFAGSDTLATAKVLAAAVRALGGFDLILCGRRAADGETGQVGPMLASLMNIACVANATRLEIDGSFALADQLTESGVLRWRMALPALITFCEWSYPLRLPSLTGLRRAGQAEIRRFSPADLRFSPEECGLRGSPTRVIHVSARPTGARACRMLTVEELLSKGVLP